VLYGIVCALAMILVATLVHTNTAYRRYRLGKSLLRYGSKADQTKYVHHLTVNLSITALICLLSALFGGSVQIVVLVATVFLSMVVDTMIRKKMVVSLQNRVRSSN
jgi:hypothetical protein